MTEAEFASLEIVRDCIDGVVDEVEVKEKEKEEKKEKEKEEDSILNKAWENVCAEKNLTFKDVLPTMIQKDKQDKTVTRMKRKAGKLWEFEKKQMNMIMDTNCEARSRRTKGQLFITSFTKKLPKRMTLAEIVKDRDVKIDTIIKDIIDSS